MPLQSSPNGERTAWEFTLTRDTVSTEEQAHFAADIAHLGLDEVTWLVLNGSAVTQTRTSIPKVLRGYRQGKLAGVAYIMECRRFGQSLFAQSRLATIADRVGLPICIWLRQGAMSDGVSNPGFVAEGVMRHDFVSHAAAFLRRSYLLGGLLEGEGEKTAGAYAAFPFPDYGIIDLLGKNTSDELYPDSKNLRRKLNKFRNKGGEIEVIQGALSPELNDATMRCMNSVKAVLVSPFQDNYNNMVLGASAHQHPRIIHFLAHMEGHCVGYHTFAHSGNGLHCLSGAFDRTRHSNYHAYENLILASIDYGLAQRLQAIQYGMVVNETKAKMMTRFVKVKQRYFARFAMLNGIVGKVMEQTRMTAPDIAAYANMTSPVD